MNRKAFISGPVGRVELWNKSLERTGIQRVMNVIRVQHSVLIMKENENYYVSLVASCYSNSQPYRRTEEQKI
jgi:hypothetical protein